VKTCELAEVGAASGLETFVQAPLTSSKLPVRYRSRRRSVFFAQVSSSRHQQQPRHILQQNGLCTHDTRRWPRPLPCHPRSHNLRRARRLCDQGLGRSHRAGLDPARLQELRRGRQEPCSYLQTRLTLLLNAAPPRERSRQARQHSHHPALQ
jgi:hypothetical protein